MTALRDYYDQDALCMPVETIIERSVIKDYKFFLGQRNFLKVVDTLQKFEKDVLLEDSKFASEFRVFKKELFDMYQI